MNPNMKTKIPESLSPTTIRRRNALKWNQDFMRYYDAGQPAPVDDWS